MSPYEILTLLVALIGAVTGLTSLMRTRRIAEKQLEFQAITAALFCRTAASHPPPTSTSVSRRTVRTTHSLGTSGSERCRIQSSSQGNRLH